MMDKKVHKLLLLFMLTAHNLHAQQRVGGMLTDEEGKPVALASVILLNGQGKLLSFQSSDETGHFSLTLPDTVSGSGLTLQVNHLGYKKLAIPLTAGRKEYLLQLKDQAIDLSEVQVKSRPVISSSGDTLRYNADSFAKPEDRSIGEVIRRMPGMEVDGNGKVKYNGKEISNLYIDGDDLLDDTYGLGTKTIPHAMVKDVEVLQNHQPLKVLKGKMQSDQVALNLTIKEEAKLKLSGQLKLGGGLPEQYDAEGNGMLFNKKTKMLNVLKGNNTGEDLGTSDIGANLLSSGTAGAPPLPKNRYYFNNSGSLSANDLLNLSNGWQVKTNIQGLADRNSQNYRSSNELYLGMDTIGYNETQQLLQRPWMAAITLNLKANKDAYYFNNDLKFYENGNSAVSSLQSNGSPLNQDLRSRSRSVSNQLEYVPELKNKDILSLHWSISHGNKPETLYIRPGVNEEVLNGGVAYSAVTQRVESPATSNQLDLKYTRPRGLVKQSYQLGADNEWDGLNTALSLRQMDGSSNRFSGSNDNQLRWQRHKLMAGTGFELESGIWEVQLSLPLTWQRTIYRDDHFELDERKDQWMFNPLARVKLTTNGQDYISFHYGYANQTGDLYGVYRGVVLTDYRSLSANDAALQQQKAHQFGLNYNYQRNISMLFMNAGINYSRGKANSIASNEVSESVSRTVLLPFENNISSLGINGGISKFLFGLGATSAVKVSYQTSRFNQFFNEQLLPYRNSSFSLTPSLEFRLWNFVSLQYEGTGTWSGSRLLARDPALAVSDRHMRRLDQSANILFSPFANTFFHFKGQHQFTSQDGLHDIRYFFADVSIRYKMNPWRADIELGVTNLANVRSYETYSLSANQFGYSNYELRGRMGVLKATFNL